MSRPHPLLGHDDVYEIGVPVATVWTAPDAPRPVDALAVADLPDPALWTAAMDAGVRKDLNGRTLTQLLLGEGVLVLEEHGDWARVAALWQPSSAHETGYPGWVRRAHLSSPVPRRQGPTAYVTEPAAPCRLADGTVLELSYGTVLWVDRTDPAPSTATVLLPGGRTGTVSLADVRLGDKDECAVVPPAEDLLAAAGRFLGLRYLWGGTSGWGLDCSGLVHLVFRAHGLVVPRDAFDQAASVEPVLLDDVRPGDLYFFARPGERVYHVGFVSRPVGDDGVRWMLHAPEGGELIEDAPLAPHRQETLVAAGRVRSSAD